MGYATGQITGSGTPAPALIAEIETLLTAHASWAFVEEVVSGSYIHRIWENAFGGNSWGQTFYIDVMRTSDTSTVIIKCFEKWNTTTKLAKRGCYDPSNTSITPDVTYASGRGETEDSLDSAFYFNDNASAEVSTVDFNYWCIVSSNGVFIHTDANTYPGYAGLFEPFWNHAQEFPIWVWIMGYNINYNGSSTSRRPGFGGVTTSRPFAINNSSNTSTQWTRVDGTVNTDLQVLYGDKVLGSRFAVSNYTVTGGKYRGLAYDCLCFNTATGINVGDTMTLGTDTYVYFGYSFWVNTDAI